jgi:hypothetical protein
MSVKLQSIAKWPGMAAGEACASLVWVYLPLAVDEDELECIADDKNIFSNVYQVHDVTIRERGKSEV